MYEKREIAIKVLEKAAERIVLDDVSSDEDARKIIEEEAFKYKNHLDVEGLIRLVDRVFGKLRGQLGPISYLLDSTDISEIMVNGENEIFVERNGRIERVEDCFDSREELEQIIRRIAASVRREINELTPILDARLSDGSRVSGVLRNVALDGPVLTVRKFRHRKITLDEMVETGELTLEAKTTLEKLVLAGYNIFVSGDNVIIGLSPSDFRKRGSHGGLVHICLRRQ